MRLCPKGCGRPVTVRGLCKVHYNHARKYELNRQRWARHHSIGVQRRIQALVAIGYTQSLLAQESRLDSSWISQLSNNPRTRVNADTAARIAALYDRLSMTPGPSQPAMRRARRLGWAPPLAWDEDAIDDPAAKPDRGRRETVSWDQKYAELRELGYSDLEIMAKFDIQPESMLRQMERYGIKPSAQMVTLATSMKHRKRVDS